MRQGFRTDRGAVGGIGRYILSDETYEVDDRDPPAGAAGREVHGFAPAWKELLKEAIASKAVGLGCPHCSGKVFFPGDEMFSPVQVLDGGRIDEHGTIIPLVFVMCSNCGLVLWFSSKHLGLTWSLPG